MGKTVPTQHPAVVLRSHFNQLRALLAAALIAVIGLTVAVVILASDDSQPGDTSLAAPIGKINYGDSKYVNPSTGYPTVPFPQPEHSLQKGIDGTRYDGGPEEGTRGVLPTRQPNAVTGSRYDGSPEEGTRGPIKDYDKNSATGDYSKSPVPSPSTRYDGGPHESPRGPGFSTD